MSFTQRYIEHLQNSGKSAHTLRSFNRVLSDFNKWFTDSYGDEFNPANITTPDINEYKRHLSSVKSERTGQPMKPATVNHALATIKAFLQWASETENVSVVADLSRVKRVEQQEQAPKSLDRNAQNRLQRGVNKMNDSRVTAIIALMLNCGLRMSEVADLTVEDVKLDAAIPYVIVRHGKRGKYREVEMNKTVVDAVKKWLAVREDRPTLFYGQRGALTVKGIDYIVRQLGREAKIDGLSSHQLRHTFCHNLIEKGVSLDQVKDLAGHANIATTTIYTKSTRHDRANAVSLLD